MVQDVLGFCQKKLGGVNPGAGIYDPPPENSRVKIVLNCCMEPKFRNVLNQELPQCISGETQ